MYTDRVDKLKRALKGEQEKQTKLEAASKTADDLIVKESERIAKEDKEIAEKKRKEKLARGQRMYPM